MFMYSMGYTIGTRYTIGYKLNYEVSFWLLNKQTFPMYITLGSLNSLSFFNWEFVIPVNRQKNTIFRQVYVQSSEHIHHIMLPHS